MAYGSVILVSSLSQIPPEIMKEDGFKTYTAAHHLRSQSMLCIHTHQPNYNEKPHGLLRLMVWFYTFAKLLNKICTEP